MSGLEITVHSFEFPELTLELWEADSTGRYFVGKEGEDNPIGLCQPKEATPEALKAEATRIYSKLTAAQSIPATEVDQERFDKLASEWEELGYYLSIEYSQHIGTYFNISATNGDITTASSLDEVETRLKFRRDVEPNLASNSIEVEQESDTPPDDEPPQGKRRKPKQPKPTPPPAPVEHLTINGNPGHPSTEPYSFNDFSHLAPGSGAKTKLKYNKQALQTLHQLTSQKRQPTAAERDKLARYVGNGTIASAIDREYLELTLDPQASLDTDTAYQTSPELVSAIWEVLEGMGFTHGRILEPAANIGLFPGLQNPEHRKLSEWVLCELNPDAVAIARYLHTDAIAIYGSTPSKQLGFEKAPIPANSLDLVISNFPFGQIAPFDPQYADHKLNLHNYFALKSFDSLRIGGIAAFITSSYMLDSSVEFCQFLADRGAKLIGAVRLPSNAFKVMGTEVSTDLVFIQKLGEAQTDHWTRTRETDIINRNGETLSINEYYHEHPENILGTLAPSTLYAGQTVLGVKPDERNLVEAVKNAFKPIGKIYAPQPHPISLKSALLPEEHIGLNPYAFIEQDGRIYQYRPGEGLALVTEHTQQIKDGMRLKRTLDKLIDLEVSDAPEGDIEAARTRLNGQYGDFCKKYGNLLNPYKRPSSLRLFEDDSELFSMLWALEETVVHEEDDKKWTEYKKQDIFYKRVSGKLRTDEQRLETVTDAVNYSLNQTGELNLNLVASLTGKSIDEAIAELNSGSPQVFYDPALKSWTLRSEYLSGDTRQKQKLIATIKQIDSELFNQYHLHYNETELGQKDKDGKYTNINPYLLPPADAEIRANLAKRLKDGHDIDAELSSKMFITGGLGTPWIETGDIESFTAALLDVSSDSITCEHVSGLGLWGLKADSLAEARGKKSEYATGERSAIWLIEQALNQQKVQIDIWTTDISGNKVKDKEASQKASDAAIAQQERIKAEFKKWLWTDTERCWQYTLKYNQLFPRPRKRKFDAPWMTLPHSNSAITLRPHQLAGVNRILQTNAVLMLWEVGVGKTLPLIAATYEAKRISRVRKPMLVVLKSTLSQIVGTYKALYPNARLLVAEGEDKNKTFVKIQTGDYDCIILTHDQFYSLPVSSRTKIEYIEEQIELVREYLDQTDKSDRGLRGELEAYEASLSDEIDRIQFLDSLEQSASEPDKLKAILSKALSSGNAEVDEKGNVRYISSSKKNAPRRSLGAKEQKAEDRRRDNLSNSVERAMGHYSRNTVKGVNWERLGIDFIGFDECHALKNLKTPSKLYGVAGVSMPDTQRTLNSLLKFRNTADNNGKIVGATGTMPTNTIAEVYVMQRFFDPAELDRTGTKHFDSWIGQFAEATTGLEFTSTGGIKAKTRICRFKNMPQLMDMNRSFTDFATADQVGIKRPEPHRITITAKPNRDQLTVMQQIADYMLMWKSGKDKGAKYFRDGRIIEHNPLTLTNMGSQNSIDPRLVDPEAENHFDSKINQLVHNVWHIRQASEPIKGTQLIFCDTGTPGSANAARFTVYSYIRDALIGLGEKPEEIAFIHDYSSDKKRKKLFEDINSGKIRYLLASTEKGGTGVNVQDLCVALHNIDMSWTPAKQVQRTGRGHRQGNKNPRVFIFYYGTEGKNNQPGFDAYKSKLVSDKAAFIYQYMSDSITDCIAEDIGDDAAMYMMAAAILSGNGSALEHAKLSDQIRKLEADLEQQSGQLSRNHYTLSRLDGWIEKAEGELEAAKADLATAQRIGDLNGTNFRIQITGRTYTKFSEAANAIEVELMKLLAEPGYSYNVRELGSVGGFKLMMSRQGKYAHVAIHGKLAEHTGCGHSISFSSLKGVLHGLKSELSVISSVELVAAIEKRIEEYKHDNQTLPGKIKTITQEVERIKAELAPLKLKEIELKAKLQEGIKEEGEGEQKIRKLPDPKSLVPAPTPALYSGVEEECIEYLKQLPEPTAKDADGNLIEWIPTIRAQSEEMIKQWQQLESDRQLLENAYQQPAVEQPSIQIGKIETVKPVVEQSSDRPTVDRVKSTQSEKPARAKVEKSDRPIAKPAKETATPKQEATPKTVERKVESDRPTPPNNVVDLASRRRTPKPTQPPSSKPQQPVTQKDVKKALRGISKAVSKQFLALGQDAAAVERVMQATLEAAKREMGLIEDIDGFRYEDQTLAKGKVAGAKQGCLF